jgi:Pyruvate/2-oxoacid:ferredoxin oxidoreductase delta subunit
MTLIILALISYFILRRLVINKIRLNTIISNYILLILTALPFLTGYLLAHETLNDFHFLSDNMLTIHILSAEAMILMAVVLFTKATINKSACTGCAACELVCPTGTLQSKDKGKYRSFYHSLYQCLDCALCVSTCPESAVELNHEISFSRFSNVFRKDEIRRVDLQTCDACGVAFAPEPVLMKVSEISRGEYSHFCSRCRRENLGIHLHPELKAF